MSERPDYVPWGGAQTYPQPLELRGTLFRGYVLEADPAALRALCDRYLNGPARGAREYHPLLPRVMLGVAAIERIACTDLPPDRQFWLPEVDVAFWVPVVGGHRRGPVFVAEDVAWFLPYLVVNHPWAYVSGRELYGFPKEYGTIVASRDMADPGPITVDTWVVPEFGPDAEVEVGRLIEVERVGGDGPASAWGDWKEALGDLARAVVGSEGIVTLPGPGVAVEAFELLVRHEMPLVFLKQFRHIADGRLACYQAVAEAPARVTKFRGGGWLPGEHRVRVTPYASHRIAEDLGLAGPQSTAVAAWYLDFDFVLENGREVGPGR
jgi:hypothetical protein